MRLTVYLILLTIGLLITGYFVILVEREIKFFHAGLKTDSEKAKLILTDEVKKFVFGLQGAKGALVADNMRFNRQNFRKYAESREFFANFRGTLGFGFIRWIKPGEFPTYLRTKSRLDPEFKVHPEVSGDTHMIIEFVEPVETNRAAVGLDIAFDKNRREAALYAAQMGQSALTKRISLVQSKASSPGFLYFLPIYRTITTPQNIGERMRELLGWAYAPIEGKVLFSDIAAKFPPDLSLKIDFGDGSEDLIVGDNPKNSRFFRNDFSAPFELGGQIWRLEFSANPQSTERAVIFLLLLYLVFMMAFFIAARAIIRLTRTRDQALDEQSSWLRAILASAAHSVIATDTRGTITTFNAAAERMLGFSATELVGLKTPAAFHDEDEVVARARELSKELGSVVEPGFETFVAKTRLKAVEVNEWTYIAKDGTRFPVRLYVTAIRSSADEIIGFLGIAEDLTQQNLMKETIENQRVRMTQEAKMAVLGEMAGGIAHEINTPLAIISGNAELVRVKIESAPDFSSTVQQLNKIVDTTQRIARVIRGLLQFSRNAESDNPEIILISEIVSMTLDLCRTKLAHGEVKLQNEIPTDLLVHVRSIEVSQILINLIGNAMDAVEHLSEKWILLKAEARGALVLLSVIDSGKGIDPTVAEKIMIPFFTTKEVGKGTGLGLSISKGLAEQNGGRLYLDKLSPNTRFVLEIPKASTLG